MSKELIKNTLISIDRGIYNFKLGIYTSLYGIPMRPFDLQLKHRKVIGAEIGVYKGDHADSMLRNLDIEKIYLMSISSHN